MMKTIFLIAAAIGLSVAGCSAMGANTSLYSANQPVVTRTTYAIDINSDGPNGISAPEKTRLAEWLNALNVGYGDRVSVDFGDGQANAPTQQVIKQMAADFGIFVAESAPVTAGQIAQGTVRVVLIRSSASVPNCPNWSKTTDVNYNLANHPNYGCALNSNIAAMIADPEDLVRGNASNALDKSAGSQAIKKYRQKTSGGQ